MAVDHKIPSLQKIINHIYFRFDHKDLKYINDRIRQLSHILFAYFPGNAIHINPSNGYLTSEILSKAYQFQRSVFSFGEHTDQFYSNIRKYKDHHKSVDHISHAGQVLLILVSGLENMKHTKAFLPQVFNTFNSGVICVDNYRGDRYLSPYIQHGIKQIRYGGWQHLESPPDMKETCFVCGG